MLPCDPALRSTAESANPAVESQIPAKLQPQSALVRPHTVPIRKAYHSRKPGNWISVLVPCLMRGARSDGSFSSAVQIVNSSTQHTFQTIRSTVHRYAAFEVVSLMVQPHMSLPSDTCAFSAAQSSPSWSSTTSRGRKAKTMSLLPRSNANYHFKIPYRPGYCSSP